MTSEVLKVELSPETCCICGSDSEDLANLEEHDAALQIHDTPLRAQFLALSQNKSLPSGGVCGSCVSRAATAFEFQSSLRRASVAPSLSEKVRALRRRLLDLTQKIDVFIVVGEAGEAGGGEDVVAVERAALEEAAAADARGLAPAADSRGARGYQCSVCPRSFPRALELRRHEREHPPGAAHSCWTCSARFSSREALREHAAAAHAANAEAAAAAAADASGAWRCPARACRLPLASRAELSAHAAASHGRGAAEPVCPACFQRPRDARALSAHLLAHRAPRSFLCAHGGCVLRFPTRNNLMSHIRKCHAPSAPTASTASATDTPLCPHCSRTFATVAAMKRHARIHTTHPSAEFLDSEDDPLQPELYSQ